MYFDHLIGLEKRDERDVIEIDAVRGILIKNNRVLMIELIHGQVMLPGGRIEPGETHEEAVKREILEETGYGCKRISPLIGKVLERKTSFYHQEKLVEMTSFFYVIEPSDVVFEQTLEAYEKELGYKPVWIELSEAIEINEIFRKKLPDNDQLISRDIYVLPQISKIGFEAMLNLIED